MDQGSLYLVKVFKRFSLIDYTRNVRYQTTDDKKSVTPQPGIEPGSGD